MERDNKPTRFQRFKEQLFDGAVIAGASLSMRYGGSAEAYKFVADMINKKKAPVVDMQPNVDHQLPLPPPFEQPKL